MPLNTLEKQLADRYLKRYLQNLKFKPDGYYKINQQILNEIKKFKTQHPLHGQYLELKYILGKTAKQIQKDIAYAKTQSFLIQSEALTIFTQYINSNSLNALQKSITQTNQPIYSINHQN